MNYKLTVGLEIHVELNTKTKMFCSCSASYFGEKPNTHTCPVCLGLPGALPYINREALESCIKIGLALNCSVNKDSRFERKNYFYPDLPKGYQISQYRWPLCTDGYLELSNGKKIRVNRVHQEEDTAKLVHQLGNSKSEIINSKNGTGVDFNRSGVPLVEMVTEPDFETSDEVVEFAKKFHQIVRDLGVSNADMERGDMRLEANVSVRPEGQKELANYRIELKNINSFTFMKHAIEYEFKRQVEALEKGEILSQETRGWSEDKKQSFLQRTKEEAHDYRYFPEPDLPAFNFTQEDVERIKSSMSELGSAKAARLNEEYGISNASTLISQGMADYFEEAVKVDPQVSAKDIANAIINKRVDTSGTVEDFIEKLKESRGGQKVSDDIVNNAVDEVLQENPDAVENYKKGNTNSLQFLVGQVMRKTQGKADANAARQMLEERLK